MKVIFLDFDGVLNSYQSANFWRNRRDQAKLQPSKLRAWPGTLEYLAQEFCPIALSNVEELILRAPDVKIVVSSTWRLGETVESLKKILAPSKLVSDAIIGVTPYFHDQIRGTEIKHWLDRHPEVTHYAIIDDDNDMLEEQRDNFVHTSSMHGYLYGDMCKTLGILGEKNPW